MRVKQSKDANAVELCLWNNYITYIIVFQEKILVQLQPSHGSRRFKKANRKYEISSFYGALASIKEYSSVSSF